METRKLTLSVAVLTVISAIFALMVLTIVPAYAHHKDGHDNGGGKNESTEQTSDHDGDADSDPNTAQEDSHADEPDATPSDNRHPSGKDRSGESGGSGNQGKAESNPDDSKGPMRYEGGLGDDKPGGPGGTDRDDQDGNNGCGNDDDFDDDNNGHCGKPADQPTPNTDDDEDEVIGEVITGPCDKDGDMANGVQACDSAIQPSRPDEVDSERGSEVLGIRAVRAAGRAVVGGVRATHAVMASALPFTGGAVTPYLLVGFALILSGALLARSRSAKATS